MIKKNATNLDNDFPNTWEDLTVKQGIHIKNKMSYDYLLFVLTGKRCKVNNIIEYLEFDKEIELIEVPKQITKILSYTPFKQIKTTIPTNPYMVEFGIKLVCQNILNRQQTKKLSDNKILIEFTSNCLDFDVSNENYIQMLSIYFHYKEMILKLIYNDSILSRPTSEEQLKTGVEFSPAENQNMLIQRIAAVYGCNMEQVMKLPYTVVFEILKTDIKTYDLNLAMSKVK